jgi:hypothetical protein
MSVYVPVLGIRGLDSQTAFFVAVANAHFEQMNRGSSHANVAANLHAVA